jgi:hypothetical protein
MSTRTTNLDLRGKVAAITGGARQQALASPPRGSAGERSALRST